MNRALFLDRDGIINIDKTYIYKFEDVEWVDGIFNLIDFGNKNGFLVIVLTNQSGVAQKMYTEDDVKTLHNKMTSFLASKKLHIDDWFYCTEYDSERRKPRPGMMIDAQKIHNIDLSKSFMVGDKITDILEIEGPKTFLLRGKYPLATVENDKKVKIFNSLDEILEQIKKEI